MWVDSDVDGLPHDDLCRELLVTCPAASVTTSGIDLSGHTPVVMYFVASVFTVASLPKHGLRCLNGSDCEL